MVLVLACIWREVVRALGRESAGEGGTAGSWGHRTRQDKMRPLYTLSVGKVEGEGNKILLRYSRK